ncbi:sensor histidine kinase KdpD [Massilia sp. CF038]|uniref:sensor histidine kinase n=1 Tax=Massilia sp. CF038 TaxID=1881045 RepID=UPI00090FD185|nr:HAMP domain-containing sensor histidine kinase [Massilia sp. CF038]SHH24478.1 Signal transduction histidine kinase [Massilia sp. CF038]
MRLDQFIDDSMDAILAEWEAFAGTQAPAADQMSPLALRDHARQILSAIALDIGTLQNDEEQLAKSQGLAPDAASGQSAASIHGALRQASDFSLLQLSAEFRALRATVLRLWLPHVSQMNAQAVQHMVRFNEAIDQALAESVVTYSARADHTRELFLAILGHDLRAPLSSMTTAGDLLSQVRLEPAKVADIGLRVKRGARLMSAMVEDLIGYTRTQLGAGMPTILQAANLRAIGQAALDDASATHPATRFDMQAEGVLDGQFDGVRMQQLLTNLLVNGAQYGTEAQPVRLRLTGSAADVTIAVTNDGPVIATESLETIFSPLVQLPGVDPDARPRTSLGLGLFVAREIALAHGGSIHAASSEQAGTVFTVILPRTSAA